MNYRLVGYFSLVASNISVIAPYSQLKLGVSQFRYLSTTSNRMNSFDGIGEMLESQWLAES